MRRKRREKATWEGLVVHDTDPSSLCVPERTEYTLHVSSCDARCTLVILPLGHHSCDRCPHESTAWLESEDGGFIDHIKHIGS